MGDASTTDERQAYLDDLVRERGYVLPYHRIMVEADLGAMQAMQSTPAYVYKRQRLLDARTKELLIIVVMVAMRLPAEFIRSHVKLALDFGASAQEILEAIELVIPDAGVPAFQHGLMAWAAVTGVVGLQPSVDAYDGEDQPTE